MCVTEYTYNRRHNQTDVTMCDVFHGEVHDECVNYYENHEPVTSVVDCFNPTLRGSVDKHVEQFVNFITEHSKIYNTISTFVQRFYVFKDNMHFAEQENNKGHSYTLGPNFMADYTNAEYIDTFLNKEYQFPRDYCKDKSLHGSFPSAVDWVDKGAVTPVKDQGQCGSCWAFSTVGALEGKNAIETGDLIAYSEQELVDCAGSYGNHGCNGGLMQRAFSYVIDKGMTVAEDYPYVSGVTKKAGTCQDYNVDFVMNSCSNVPANEEQLTLACANQPISVSIEADQRSFQLYTSGVYDSPDCGTTLDHGVLLVGYGHMDGQDYYRVKNSWSSSWGDNGYIYMARNSVSSSKQGQCGIAMDASYPDLE
jgi:hypothetical protein